MERRTFLAMAFSLSLGAMVLPGCGGGGGGGSRQATVQLALPSGFALTPSQLTIGTGHGSQVADASGRATIPIGSKPTLAWARAADNVPLLGFVDAGGTQSLSARSTAVALLYLALGGSDIPVGNASTVLTLLDAHAAVGPLAGVLAARLAANPRALVDADATLADALKTALTAILADRPTTRGIHALSRQAALPAQLLIEPAALQSNVELVQGQADQTFVATNHGRRHCEVLVYEIGKVDADGVRTDYPKAKRVVDPVSLGSTRALGFLSTLWGFFSGSTAFVPVSTDPIRLNRADSASKTFFQTVVLGSTLLPTGPAFFAEPRYADEVAAWRSTMLHLNLVSWFADILFGILMELWGLRDVTVSEAALVGALGTLKNLQIPAWLAVIDAAEQGKLDLATQLFFKLFASDASFARELQAVLATLSGQIAAIVGQDVSSASIQLVSKAVSGAFALVGVAMGAGDLGAVLWDLSHAQPAERWDLTLFQPTVRISPTSATIAPGGRVSFTVSIPAGQGGAIEYDWTQTGANATLSAGAGTVGSHITTTSTVVDLVTSPSDTGTITVTVAAFRVPAGSPRVEIGQAQALVTLGSASVTLPASILIFTVPITVGQDAGKFRVMGFYTVTPPRGGFVQAHMHRQSNELWIGGALDGPGYSDGAPVVDRSADTSTWHAYRDSANWFNLGGGLVGHARLASGNITADLIDLNTDLIRQNLERAMPVVTTFE